MSGFDESRENFLELLKQEGSTAGDRNEAMTRLQVIDEIFFSCLDWDKIDDCEVEDHLDGKFADYIFKAPIRQVVVEAKKEGEYFSIPLGKIQRNYSLNHLCASSKGLREAVEQAAEYCQKRGIPIGIVTNGHQFVAFVASRDDGRPPLAGRAILFRSLQDVADHFTDFWNLFSKTGIAARELGKQLAGKAAPQVPPRLQDYIPDYPGQTRRNHLQTELQNLAEFLLEDIPQSPEIEQEFLRKCYCTNNALSQYSLLAKDFLKSRYHAIFDGLPESPSVQPVSDKKGIAKNFSAESIYRRPVLLVGDVGVGKTTFIRNLIRVDASDVFENAIYLYINLGSGGILAGDLEKHVLDEIALQLLESHEIDVDERSVVREIYKDEIVRFERGIWGDLKHSNPDLYLEKEIGHLEKLVNDRSSHIRAVLAYQAAARRKQFVIFLDNVDQRDDQTQQSVFLIAHEIAQSWPAAVFVAIRPETYRTSHSKGSLSGYHTRAFTIAPPRLDILLEKRILFGLSSLATDTVINSHSIDGGSVESVKKFLSVVLHTIRSGGDVVEFLDNISRGNMRVALGHLKSFIGSAHTDSDKIISTYDRENRYIIPLHEFIRSILFGENSYYVPAESPVFNLFDIGSSDGREHFLAPLVLGILTRTDFTESNSGFVGVEKIYDWLQNVGFLPQQVGKTISRLWHDGLIESSGRIRPLGADKSREMLRVTSSGAYHLKRLISKFVYIDAIITNTPIVDQGTLEELTIDMGNIDARLKRASMFADYLSSHWNEDELGNFFNWELTKASLEEDVATAKVSARKPRNRP